MITAENMQEYGFPLTHIFPYRDRIKNFCPYTGKYGSTKIVIWHILHSDYFFIDNCW